MTTATEAVSPAMQALLDEQRKLMRHDLEFGLGKSGTARLKMLATEITELEDIETDNLQTTRLTYVGAREACHNAIEEAVTAWEEYLDKKEKAIALVAHAKPARNRAIAAGIEVEPLWTFEQLRAKDQPNRYSKLWIRDREANGEW